MKQDLPEVQVRLQQAIAELMPADPACRAVIGELRREMDRLCDQGKLSISAWRQLLDQLASVQDRHLAAHAVGRQRLR